jgi:putative zinc finger/helix-turn-helix YgiT family protein
MKTETKLNEEVRDCPICGEHTLRSQVGEFNTEFQDAKGTLRNLIVPHITWQHCSSCDETILEHGASELISEAQRRVLGLLTAKELQTLRNRLKKTQEEMSDLLGVGKKTYCRWESGSHFQSEGFDRYLRLLQLVPQNVTKLESMKATRVDVNALSTTFKYIPDVSKYEALGQQFVAILQDGPFQYV